MVVATGVHCRVQDTRICPFEKELTIVQRRVRLTIMKPTRYSMARRRPLFIVPALLSAAAIVSACSSSPSTTAGSAATNVSGTSAPLGSEASINALKEVPAIHALVDKGHLTNGVVWVDDPIYPTAYSMNSQNQEVGYAVDFEKAVAKVMGVKEVVKFAQFDQELLGIQSGRYDSSQIDQTTARLPTYDFVDVLTDGTSLLVDAGNPHHLDINNLCGVAVATEAGGAQQETVLPALSSACTKAGHPAIKATIFPAATDSRLALLSGHVEAVIDPSVGVDQVAAASDGKLEVLPTVIFADSSGYGFKKNNPIVPAVAQAFAYLIKDGEFAAILNKWGIGNIGLPCKCSEIDGKVIKPVA
jgi:polar amino acid transport system substrate-binding protein